MPILRSSLLVLSMLLVCTTTPSGHPELAARLLVAIGLYGIVVMGIDIACWLRERG